MKTPLIFVGHGSPMNAVEDNEFTMGWQKIGREIEQPKAIVCMSAHWLTKGSFITSNLKPEIIYDFYGFPKSLYLVKYPANGSLEYAQSIHQECANIQLDDKWGLDHGAWVVLKKMFPEAQIPVLQLSIDFSSHPSVQLELMNKIKSLRNEGIMFIGSGNIVHNLQLASFNGKPFDWALEFEDKSKKMIAQNKINELVDYKKFGAISQLAIPTDDHYRPMLNTMAMKFENEEPDFFNVGVTLGSISMMSFIYR